MAQRVNIVLVDDIDGTDASETVAFGLDGTSYEIDLNEKNAAQLRDALASYVGHARKVEAEVNVADLADTSFELGPCQVDWQRSRAGKDEAGVLRGVENQAIQHRPELWVGAEVQVVDEGGESGRAFAGCSYQRLDASLQ